MRRAVTILGVVVGLATLPRGATAQPPARHHWTLLSSDSSITAWMDTTHITKDSGGLVGGWYKTKASSEPISTVVHYEVDCAGFRLTPQHIIAYDGTGKVIDDRRPANPFVYPPPLLPLQNFMHYVCRRFPPK